MNVYISILRGFCEFYYQDDIRYLCGVLCVVLSFKDNISLSNEYKTLNVIEYNCRSPPGDLNLKIQIFQEVLLC